MAISYIPYKLTICTTNTNEKQYTMIDESVAR
jgi:hypothetical protein